VDALHELTENRRSHELACAVLDLSFQLSKTVATTMLISLQTGWTTERLRILDKPQQDAGSLLVSSGVSSVQCPGRRQDMPIFANQ
jgi:hypothetical protein